MAPSIEQTPTVKFVGLDAMRFFAAFAIVFYHATQPLAGTWYAPLQLLTHNLTIGVDFFFLISGFLITYLLIAEKGRTSTVGLGAFYVRRFLRIFPLYYLVVAVAYWWYHASNPEIDFSKYLYFWGNFWMIATDKWTVAPLNPLWSLCIEEHFYLVIPVLVVLLPIRWLGALFATIVLASAGFRLYATLTLPYNWMSIYAHTLSRCDVLALGGLLAWQHYRQPIRWQLPNWTFYLGLALLALLLSVVDVSDVSNAHLATFKKYLYVLPLLFLFGFVVFNEGTLGLPRLMPVLNYLGKISYGLYMYHMLVAVKLLELPLMQAHLKLHALGIIAITPLVAALSYELFEKQILRLKGRFERVRTVRA